MAPEYPESDSQEPVTTYNGVPRKSLRKARPLVDDEIRLLDLEYGTHESPLTGSLRIVRLSDNPVYEPLSYTWEDDDTAQPSKDNIKDDVHPALFLLDTDCSLDLTPNCARALCSVRKSTADRTIWVDSICVNQDDPEERSRQVDMMKGIYSRAFRVLVYLGREATEHDSSSSLAMALLCYPDQMKRSGQLSQRETISLKRLFERRYFRRMWIVQEVALAQTIDFHCGCNTSLVPKFAGSSLDAVLRSQVTPPWLKHAIRTVSEETWPRAPSILGWIFDTALCACKDDRDRIFALFSLLQGSGEGRWSADYTLSTAQVYSGVAAYLATDRFWWAVLVLAPRLALDSRPGLPSWVPNWSSLGKYGLKAPKLPKAMLSGSEFTMYQPKPSVARSGVFTIRGMFLGSVTDTAQTCDYQFQYSGMDEDQRLTTDLFASQPGPCGSRQRHGHVSIWSLTKMNQDKSLHSWQCHLNFVTRCKQPEPTHHLAFMLSDYATVLILRHHERFQDQYTLVEAGKPLVGAVLPHDWEVDSQDRPHFGLDSIKRIGQNRYHRQSILSSHEESPRLAKFSRLWGLNPSTMRVSLTHRAVQEIRRIDMGELDLLQRCQDHGRKGMQILRDPARLRYLIDEVNGLRHEDYAYREVAAGLDRRWSLSRFLRLFVKNPSRGEATARSDVQPHGAPSPDEIDLLSQLMQWAQVTRLVLRLLSRKQRDVSHWSEMLMDKDVYLWASTAADFQLSVDESRDPSRTSALLERILCQLPEVSSPGVEQIEESCSGNESGCDWERLNLVVGEMISILGHIQTDVRKIQSQPSYARPEFKALAAHQLFAAHGVDVSRNYFTQIRIR